MKVIVKKYNMKEIMQKAWQKAREYAESLKATVKQCFRLGLTEAWRCAKAEVSSSQETHTKKANIDTLKSNIALIKNQMKMLIEYAMNTCLTYDDDIIATGCCPDDIDDQYKRGIYIAGGCPDSYRRKERFSNLISDAFENSILCQWSTSYLKGEMDIRHFRGEKSSVLLTKKDVLDLQSAYEKIEATLKEARKGGIKLQVKYGKHGIDTISIDKAIFTCEDIPIEIVSRETSKKR